MAVLYSVEGDSTMPNAKDLGDMSAEQVTAPADRGARRGTIQSVDRAARILKALASGPRRLGVSQLADQLGLTRPTVHGLLQTLQLHGFVEQDRESDKYQLGAGLLHLGASYLDFNELRRASIVHAERLAEHTGAAVRVGVLHGPAVVVVHHVFRPDAAFQVLEVGAQLPVHATALGKVLLAFGPEGLVDELLAEPRPKLTSRTLGPAALRTDLERVREAGVARERGEAVLGEASLAAPIFDRDGHAVGAIGIVDEIDRLLARGRAAAATTAVVEAARSVSRELGAGRWSAPLS